MLHHVGGEAGNFTIPIHLSALGLQELECFGTVKAYPNLCQDAQALFVDPHLVHFSKYLPNELHRSLLKSYLNYNSRVRDLFTPGQSIKNNPMDKMNHGDPQLARALSELRKRVADLEQNEAERKRSEAVQAALYRISEATQADQSQDELFKSIHAIISKLMPAKNFYISLYDESTGFFTVPYQADEFMDHWPSYKPGKGLGAYVLRTGKPLLATPEVFTALEKAGEAEIIDRRMVDWLGVPLKTQHGKTIGVMAVQTYTEEYRLQETNLDVLMFVSTQVAMAIERKQAAQALQQQAQELTALNLLGQRVNASLLLDHVVKATIENVMAMNQFEAVFFYLCEDGQLVLKDSGANALSAIFLDQEGRCKPGEYLCEMAAKAGESIYSDNLLNDPRSEKDEPKEVSFLTYAAIPLCARDEVIGVLGLGSAGVHDFRAEATFWQTFANQVATATQNALLHAQVQQYAAELEQRVAQRTIQLETTNKELEAFSYSVSHDLRGPLRAINGYIHILQEEHAAQLDAEGQELFKRVRKASQHMGQLIDDLLKLSRLTQQEVIRVQVDLGALAKTVLKELREAEPGRSVEIEIGEGLTVNADPRLLRVVLANLFNNSLKFTRKNQQAKIEFNAFQNGEEKIFFVRDNGAGFDMQFAGKLFGAFERLHNSDEFEGSGIGLATVQRIIRRHGGRVWAEAAVNQGATIFFTLG
jgi:K+-sensing histidine kinase KdpD